METPQRSADDLSWLWEPDAFSPLQQANRQQFSEYYLLAGIRALGDALADFAAAFADFADSFRAALAALKPVSEAIRRLDPATRKEQSW